MSLLPSGAAIEVYIKQAARLMAERIEEAVRNLMESEGLTRDDLRNRGLITHYPDGRVVLTIDGDPKLEWNEGASDIQETADG